MNARELTKALGGRWYGSYGSSRCPAHSDRNPSLSVRDSADGKLLIRCHAGCEQHSVIAALQDLKLWPGGVEASAPQTVLVQQRRRQEHAARDCGQDAKRRDALAIWQSATPAGGTLVETYLGWRGLHLPTPTALRFHHALKHPSEGIWPAMVALVTRGVDDTPLGVHRTFLARDGNGRAPVDPQRMMLGPCSGGAARLAAAGDVLMVGEGIETCLAAMQATSHPVWAALSTSGLRAALSLPVGVDPRGHRAPLGQGGLK
jgi:hypothetical protein